MSRLDDLIAASKRIAALGVTQATLTREAQGPTFQAGPRPANVWIETSPPR